MVTWGEQKKRHQTAETACENSVGGSQCRVEYATYLAKRPFHTVSASIRASLTMYLRRAVEHHTKVSCEVDEHMSSALQCLVEVLTRWPSLRGASTLACAASTAC